MNNKSLGMIGAGAASVGVFLPFVEIPSPWGSMSVTYAVGDGLIVLGLMIVAFVFLLMGRFRWTLAPSIASLAMLFFDTFQIMDESSTALSLGLGWFVVLVGLLTLIFAGIRKPKE